MCLYRDREDLQGQRVPRVNREHVVHWDQQDPKDRLDSRVNVAKLDHLGLMANPDLPDPRDFRVICLMSKRRVYEYMYTSKCVCDEKPNQLVVCTTFFTELQVKEVPLELKENEV